MGMDDNGRTDDLRPSRAFLHFATRLAVLQRTHEPCVPTKGYTSRFDGDGRQRTLSDGLSLSRVPMPCATRLIGLVVRFAELRSQCWLAHLKKVSLRQAA